MLIFGACSGGALSAGDSATAGAWDELQGAWEGRVAVCRDRRPAAVVSRLAVPAFARHPSPPPSVVLSMTHVSAVDCYAVIAAFYPFIHYLPFYWNVAFTNFWCPGLREYFNTHHCKGLYRAVSPVCPDSKFEQNHLSHRYLACWFILTLILSRTFSKLEVMDHKVTFTGNMLLKWLMWLQVRLSSLV